MTDKPLSERLPEHIFSRIYQDIGQASMCWEHPNRAGVFLAEMASKIAYDLCVFIADELEKAKTLDASQKMCYNELVTKK